METNQPDPFSVSALFLLTPFILPALITSHNLFYQCDPLSHLVLRVSSVPSILLRHFPFLRVIPLLPLAFCLRLW